MCGKKNEKIVICVLIFFLFFSIKLIDLLACFIILSSLKYQPFALHQCIRISILSDQNSNHYRILNLENASVFQVAINIL